MARKRKPGSNISDTKLTSQDVSSFERVKYQILQLHNDFTTLAKKPNDAVNKFKLNFVNEKLIEANSLLSDAFKPSENFEQFSEDDMPTTSDVLMILSQYIDSLEAWRSAHVYEDTSDTYNRKWFWATSDSSSIKAEKASRYRENQD